MELASKNVDRKNKDENYEDSQGQEAIKDKDKKKERSSPSSGWIRTFRKRPGNEWLEGIDLEFLRDFSNLAGLDEEIPHLSQGLHIILSDGLYLDGNGESRTCTKTEGKHLAAAEMLYTLVHARYILTNKGLEKIFRKYKEAFYGQCPRHYCQKSPVLPIGMSHKLGHGDVKIYCPSCEDAYHSEIQADKLADGASFGPSLPQMFFMTYPTLHPSPAIGHYTPRLFGFKIHASVFHQDGEVANFVVNKSRKQLERKSHQSRMEAKDKLKESPKENNNRKTNRTDKLPDINRNVLRRTRRQRRRRAAEDER